MGIFDQIKSAFGRDIPDPVARKEPPAPPAKPAPPPPVKPAPEPEATGPEVKTYTVQSGDTLWKIAEETLGDGNRYGEIFEGNRDVLDSPDHILPGQELKLP